MLGLIKEIAPSIFGVLDELIEDDDKKNEIKGRINERLIGLDETKIKAQASVIVAEAGGESWLQRCWRPIAMLTLVGCVLAHWLGFTPDNLTPEEVSKLLDIVQVGLGGYVLGRSAEKTAKAWKGG